MATEPLVDMDEAMLRAQLVAHLGTLGERKKICILPPDYTRFHRYATTTEAEANPISSAALAISCKFGVGCQPMRLSVACGCLAAFSVSIHQRHAQQNHGHLHRVVTPPPPPSVFLACSLALRPSSLPAKLACSPR